MFLLGIGERRACPCVPTAEFQRGRLKNIILIALPWFLRGTWEAPWRNMHESREPMVSCHNLRKTLRVLLQCVLRSKSPIMTREQWRTPPRHAHGDLTSLAPHKMLPELPARITFQCRCGVGFWSALACLTKSEKKVVTADTLSQLITQHLLNVINSSG